MRHGDKLPGQKREELERRITEHLGRMPSHDDLSASVMQNRTPVTTHAEIVVGKLSGIDAINDFVILWRKHFIETMEPKFLPDHWDVDRRFALRECDAE